jgi:hypothetical protein
VVTWPAGTVPPAELSVSWPPLVCADQVTGPPDAVIVISPSRADPRSRLPGLTSRSPADRLAAGDGGTLGWASPGAGGRDTAVISVTPESLPGGRISGVG